MNYIILFATLVVVKGKAKYQQIRLLISSIIGSAYAVMVYLNILSVYSNIIAKIILSIVMIYVAFNPQNIKQFVKKLLIFYLVSFIFGGCTFALIYFIEPRNAQMRNGVFVGTYPLKVALIAGTVAFLITQIAFKINKSKLSSKDALLKVKIYYEGKILELNALLDSGNMLKDPISGMPVIIVERQKLNAIIPEKILEHIEKIMGGDDQKEKSNIEVQKYLSKVRMIPFMSIGKENGMLVGIRIDKIRIENDDQTIEKNNVIVGVYNKKISKDNKYNALIGLNLLEGEEKHEFTTNFKK